MARNLGAVASAAISGVASLVLLAGVLIVAFATSGHLKGVSLPIGNGSDAGGSISASDSQQIVQLMQRYLLAGQKNSPRDGIAVVDEALRGDANLSASIVEDFRHRDWFTNFSTPRITKHTCSTANAILVCDVTGAIYYPDGGQTYRRFTGNFAKTAKGWRIRQFIIEPALKQ